MDVDNNARRAQLLEFVEALRHECENKLLYEAWQSCGDINEWYIYQLATFHEILAKILGIPSSIAICKKELSQQQCYQEPPTSPNKSWNTLDASIRVLLHGIELENVDWRTICQSWSNVRIWRVLSLDKIL